MQITEVCYGIICTLYSLISHSKLLQETTRWRSTGLFSILKLCRNYNNIPNIIIPNI